MAESRRLKIVAGSIRHILLQFPNECATLQPIGQDRGEVPDEEGLMNARKKNRTLWMADLDHELADLDLWEQRQRLEARIARADAWLARHPNADPDAYDRLDDLVERHAGVMDKLRMLSMAESALIGVVLPADFGGAVPPRWERLPDGRILAWFSRAELEAATLVNSALAELALDSLVTAA